MRFTTSVNRNDHKGKVVAWRLFNSFHMAETCETLRRFFVGQVPKFIQTNAGGSQARFLTSKAGAPGNMMSKLRALRV